MSKTKVFLIAILFLLFGLAGGFFIGKSQGEKSIISKQEAEQKAFQSGKEAATQLATNYFDAIKYSDFNEAYSYTCPEFQSQIDNQKYIDFQKSQYKDNSDKAVFIKDISLDDMSVESDSAKARFTMTITSPVLANDTIIPNQSNLKLINGKWCANPDPETYK